MGFNEITWKAETGEGGLSSGVYIVNLSSGKYNAASKMLLIK